MKINDIYKVIDFQKEEYFLFCLVEKDSYIWVKDCGWGFVSNTFMSGSDPIELIAGQVKAVNSKTSSGIDSIKRIYIQDVPQKVKELLK